MNRNKRTKNYIYILILSFILIIPFLCKGTVLMDDKAFHLLRIEGLSKAIENGGIFPKIYDSLMKGYGYASPLFYPDLFLYIPALLTLFGVNLTISYDIFLFIINIATGLTAYYSFNKISNNEEKALFYSFIYLYFPYRLYNFYIRNTIGELLAMIFLPLILLFVYELIKYEKCNYILLTIAFSGVINSHIISTYIVFLALLIICIINIKIVLRKSVIVGFFKAILLVILINSYFLFPFLEQLISQKFLLNNGSAFGELSNYTFKIVNIDNTFIKLLLNLGVILIGVYIIKRAKSKKNKNVWTLIFSLILIILCTTNIAFWEALSLIPFIENIQFPWRFFIITTILTPYILMEIHSLLDNSIIKKTIFKTIFLVIIFLNTLSIIYLYGYGTNIPRNFNLMRYSHNVGMGEYLPSNLNLEYISKNTYFTGNNQKEYDYEKRGNKIYINNSKERIDKNIEVPLIYYKGYKAYIGEDKDEIDLTKNSNGLVEIQLHSPIKDYIVISYKYTLIQKISLIISIISLSIFIFINTKKLT